MQRLETLTAQRMTLLFSHTVNEQTNNASNFATSLYLNSWHNKIPTFLVKIKTQPIHPTFSSVKSFWYFGYYFETSNSFPAVSVIQGAGGAATSPT